MVFNRLAYAALAFLVACSVAVETKRVHISFPNDAPDEIMSEIRQVLSSAGAPIEHVFSTFNALTAEVPTSVLGDLEDAIAPFGGVVEEEQTFSIA